ncbi:peptidoglycan DD-metalloendopeptidase family protein [Helicobacter monodelphidis]|uniref:peptidoglycan DD-metalloendopeptidase family protein n=1 Tax=Helicobacter sp. 15-1451 TaxID=2004995 RepID=UPI0015EC928B|nr:peptidoglycan DD-metalloendopeptidase family protein [Helicobacter sp. 15-1451]
MRFLGLMMCFMIALSANSFAAVVQEGIWGNGVTFLDFLDKHKIPQNLYYNLSPEDKELATEVISGNKYFILKDDKNGQLLQALIPIGEDNQIHIVKDDSTENGYHFGTIPVQFFQKQQSIALELSNSPYHEITKATNDTRLANEFAIAFKQSFNINNLQVKDKIALIYNRKYRLGAPYGSPEIVAAFVNTRNKPYYVFAYKDGRYYNEKGEELARFLLTNPVRYTRISSRFSNARKHPILGYKRPHLGVDYAAKKGTPVHAAGDGKITFVGNKGGYGRTVIINHTDGFKTLYAHLNGYAKGIRSGQFVKQGKIIAYVGNSGLSTGPHLHLGLYKHGRAINPLKSVKVAKRVLNKNEIKEFNLLAVDYKARIQEVLAQENLPFYEKAVEYLAKHDTNKDL